MVKIHLLFIFTSASFSFAFPPLTSYNYGNFSFMAPLGWTVSVDEAQGSIIISEDPDNPLTPILAFVMTPDPNQQLTPDMAMSGFLTQPDFQQYNITEIGREYLDNGALWVLVQLDDGPEVVYASAIAFADSSSSTVALSFFFGLAERFVELEGATLPFVTFGGLDPAQLEGLANTNEITVSQQASRRFPELVQYQDSIKVPQGWQVSYNANQDLLLVQENPRDNDSAFILATSTTLETHISAETIAEQVIQSMGFSEIKIVSQEWLPHFNYQALMTETTAVVQGTPVKLAVLVFFPTTNSASVGLYAATKKHFRELGGSDLLLVTLAGLEPEKLYNNVLTNNPAPTQTFASMAPADNTYTSSTSKTFPQMQEEAQNQQMYYETMSNTLRMQHENNISIINNMGDSDWCWADVYGSCY